ncbi:MAG: DUF2157 domain-containing protein [Bacteroidetes bacterium]|nr:MAG: DUF2157 domain-containing protein [Bacteroidota bacterium]
MAFKGSETLRKEIEKWVQESIISQPQADLLVQKYELDSPKAWYQDSGNILKSVAIFFVVMGFFLIIGANWSSIPTLGRVMIGLFPLLASYAGAFYFYTKNDQPAVERSMFLATLLFGANIALQSQIFHISSYFPNGILFWLLAAMPLVLYFQSSMYVITFLALYIFWLGAESGFQQFSLLSPVLLAIFAYVLYKKPSQIGFVLFGFALYGCLLNGIIFYRKASFWGSSFYFFISFSATFVLLYQSIIFYFRDRFSEDFVRKLSGLMRLFLVFWLFCFTFTEPVESLYRSFGTAKMLWWEVYVVMAISSAFFFWVAKRSVEDILAWVLSAVFFVNALIPDAFAYCILTNFYKMILYLSLNFRKSLSYLLIISIFIFFYFNI